MSEDIGTSLWVHVAGGLLLLALETALKWTHDHLGRRNPAYRVHILTAMGIVWVVVNSAYVYLFPQGAALFILVSSAIMAWITRSELHQFWRIGLVGADAQIRHGIDFKKALGLVSNSMDFLGIGAAKL